MKKIILFAFLIGLFISVTAQNQIRAKFGYISTHTAIAEYNQPGNYYYILDLVSIDPDIAGIYTALEVDLDLGKNFFMVTGINYSQKGISSISYTDTLGVSRTKTAKQNYLGLNIQLKYHYRFNDSKFGLYLASGPSINFAVGGPNYAEYSTVNGSTYFQALGTFNQVELSLYTNLGVSYKLGPGDILLEAIMINGISDAIRNKYIVGKGLSFGAMLGYSFYLD